jgi:hypothetical protein
LSPAEVSGRNTFALTSHVVATFHFTPATRIAREVACATAVRRIVSMPSS